MGEQKKTITFLVKKDIPATSEGRPIYECIDFTSDSRLKHGYKLSYYPKVPGSTPPWSKGRHSYNIEKIVLAGITKESAFDDAINKLTNLCTDLNNPDVSTTNLKTLSQSPACLPQAHTSGRTERRLAVNAALSEPKAVSTMSPLSMTLLGAGFILGGFIVASCLRKRRRSLRPLLPRYDGEEVDFPKN